MHSSAQFHAERHTRTQGDTEASKNLFQVSLYGLKQQQPRKVKIRQVISDLPTLIFWDMFP